MNPLVVPIMYRNSLYFCIFIPKKNFEQANCTHTGRCVHMWKLCLKFWSWMFLLLWRQNGKDKARWWEGTVPSLEPSHYVAPGSFMLACLIEHPVVRFAIFCRRKKISNKQEQSSSSLLFSLPSSWHMWVLIGNFPFHSRSEGKMTATFWFLILKFPRFQPEFFDNRPELLFFEMHVEKCLSLLKFDIFYLVKLQSWFLNFYLFVVKILFLNE